MQKNKPLYGTAACRETASVIARRHHFSRKGQDEASCATLDVWDADTQWQRSIWNTAASSLLQKTYRKPKNNPTAMHLVNQGKLLPRFVWQALLPYLAETLVVKETVSFENVSGVVPVISSHCAGEVPPV